MDIVSSLLLFADYSAELSKKRKLFTPLCSVLHNKKVRFALAYPAILRVTTADGQQHSFDDPEEAEIFINSLGEQPEAQHTAPTQAR